MGRRRLFSLSHFSSHAVHEKGEKVSHTASMPLSLVGLSGVLEPTRLMATTWISMRPMYDAAFVVPLEHAVERDGVTSLQ